MAETKLKGKRVIKNFILIITSVCTIFSFFYIILGDPEWTKYVAYFFMISLALFLAIVILLLGMFLFRLEPGIKDGRYLSLIIPVLFSIGSGCLYFKDNNHVNRMGLGLLIVGMAITLILILLCLYSWAIRSFTSSEVKDYIVTSVSNKLVRLGDHQYEFDVYKGIQSRIPVLTMLDTRFKWTGDKVDPNVVKVSSVTHEVPDRIKVDDDGYDSVKLVFKAPLYYKQAITCHYKLAKLSDNESPAEQYLSQMVKSTETISLISFDVVLKDVPSDYRKPAILQKKKESAPSGAKYKNEEQVPFDEVSKSYHKDLYNPKPGYDYRLYWGD